MPQQKSENNSEFSERTDRLAAVIGVKLGELPPKIGISQAMFSAYRTGKNRISEKAWRKLEQTEREFGITPREYPPVYAAGKVLESPPQWEHPKSPLEQENEALARRAIAAEEKVELMKKILRSLLDQL